MQLIPLTNDASRLVTITFTGDIGTFGFRTVFNRAISAWFVDILDDDGNELIRGIGLFRRINLIRAHPAIRDMLFDLRYITLTDDNDGRSIETLGVSAGLIQYDEGEIPEISQSSVINFNLSSVIAPA